jgi:predicted alpha/beta superfamily hydrolase
MIMRDMDTVVGNGLMLTTFSTMWMMFLMTSVKKQIPTQGEYNIFVLIMRAFVRLPIFIFGHSMGGTIALLATMERQNLFKVTQTISYS